MNTRTISYAKYDNRVKQGREVSLNHVKLAAEPPTQRLDAILQAIDAETMEGGSTGRVGGVQ